MFRPECKVPHISLFLLYKLSLEAILAQGMDPGKAPKYGRILAEDIQPYSQGGILRCDRLTNDENVFTSIDRNNQELIVFNIITLKTL